MATLKYELKVKNGTYKDRNGDEKNSWLKIGSCFETQHGLSLKIDAIPVNFDGWVSMFEPKPKEDKQTEYKRSSRTDDEFPDIPF